LKEIYLRNKIKIMSIQTLGIAGITTDSSGIYKQTDNAPDNVFIFSDGSKNWEIINKKGVYIARLGGILPHEGDMTSKLQLIFNHPDVHEVVFDNGEITVDGTLNIPSGKTVTFQNDGCLIGIGQINGGIFNANFQKKIFSVTLTINPQGVSNKYFSVKWFGATGDGTTNDQPSIQTTINTIIRNSSKVKSIFLPCGTYAIDSPIIMYKREGNAYKFFDLDFIGESSFWEESQTGTRIIANFTDTFAIGIQAGKGVRVENIKIIGKFNYAFTSPEDFYASDYENYKSIVACRESIYSPYSGIVIDPFSNSSTATPPDGGYPNYSSWYNGNGGDYGSTGVSVTDCFIVGFVCGLITSPNGSTLNAELIYVNKIQFENCKCCIAGCQAQEKLNRVSYLGCWGNCHTVLMYNYYGKSSEKNGQTGHWVIENVNLAGYNNTFINRSESGWFPMKISTVYAESLGKIGNLSLTMGTTISDSVFDMARPDSDTKQYFLSIASGVAVFKNCEIRYYGLGCPIPMDGRMVFTECKFDMPTLLPDQYNAAGERYLGTSVQDNINISGWNTLNCTYPQCVYNDSASYYFADGKTILESPLSANDAIKISHVPTYAIPYSYIMEKFATRVVIVSGTNNSFTFTATDEELSWVNNGATIGFYRADKFYGYGIANVSGSQLEIKYIPKTVTTNSYDLKVYRVLQFFTFLGDITAGSEFITNVRVDMGSASNFVNRNTIFIQNVTSSTSNSRTSFVLKGYDAKLNVLMSNKPFNVTKKGVYFSNNGYVKNISTISSNFDVFNSPYAYNYLLQKGGIITVSSGGEALSYLVTKSGYMNAIQSGQTVQAEWKLLN